MRDVTTLRNLGKPYAQVLHPFWWGFELFKSNGGSVMDVLDHLRAEHQRIQALFEQIRGERGKQQRKLLYDNISHDIHLHVYAEQNIFYPVFKTYEELTDLLTLSHSKCEGLKTLLRQLDLVDYRSVEFENKILELENHFNDHITQDESDFFTITRKIMNQRERERVGEAFQALENEREEAS
jgi:hypothetical protein